MDNVWGGPSLLIGRLNAPKSILKAGSADVSKSALRAERANVWGGGLR